MFIGTFIFEFEYISIHTGCLVKVPGEETLITYDLRLIMKYEQILLFIYLM